MKHTAGPWEALETPEPVNSQDYMLISPSGAIGYWKGGKQNHTDDAWVLTKEDAHLIAAAPELLEALEAILPYTPVFYSGSDKRMNQLGIDKNKAIAAIKKAKGETE